VLAQKIECPTKENSSGVSSRNHKVEEDVSQIFIGEGLSGLFILHTEEARQQIVFGLEILNKLLAALCNNAIYKLIEYLHALIKFVEDEILGK